MSTLDFDEVCKNVLQFTIALKMAFLHIISKITFSRLWKQIYSF